MAGREAEVAWIRVGCHGWPTKETELLKHELVENWIGFRNELEKSRLVGLANIAPHNPDVSSRCRQP